MKNKKFLAVLVAASVVVLGGVAFVVQGQLLSGNMFSKTALSGPVSGVKPLSVPVSGVKPLSVASVGWNMSRAQLAELLYTANPIKLQTRVTPECTFSDVNSTIPAKKAIEVLCMKKVIKGNPDGTYGPAHSVNRANAAVAISRMFLGNSDTETSGSSSTFADVSANQYYTAAINTLAHYKVFENNDSGSKFFPASALTVGRAQFWLQNAVKNIPASSWLK